MSRTMFLSSRNESQIVRFWKDPENYRIRFAGTHVSLSSNAEYIPVAKCKTKGATVLTGTWVSPNLVPLPGEGSNTGTWVSPNLVPLP
jgi:hypothetical protein